MGSPKKNQVFLSRKSLRRTYDKCKEDLHKSGQFPVVQRKPSHIHRFQGGKPFGTRLVEKKHTYKDRKTLNMVTKTSTYLETKSLEGRWCTICGIRE